MTGTARFGWTIPTALTKLQDIPATVAAGLQDIENDLALAGNTHTAADASTTYPAGISTMPLGSQAITDGNWPKPATNAIVITTQRGVVDNCVQLYIATVSSTHPLIWFRTSTGAGWSPFTKIAGEGQPWATDSGSTTFSNNSVAETRTITFNANAGFTSTPSVVVSTTDAESVACAFGITSTGFTAKISPNGGGSPMSSTRDRTIQCMPGHCRNSDQSVDQSTTPPGRGSSATPVISS
jgi:hypothetical protein